MKMPASGKDVLGARSSPSARGPNNYPPEREIFIDHAVVEARAYGLAFDLRIPRASRADRDPAQLKIKGETGFIALMVSPDGSARVSSMGSSNDRNLSKFVKRLLGWNAQMLKAQDARAVF